MKPLSIALVVLSGILIAASLAIPFPLAVIPSVAGLGILVFFIFKTGKSLQMKSAELAVKTSGFGALVESLNDGVVIYGSDFTVLAMNAAVEKMFSMKRSDWVGKKVEPKTSLPEGQKLFIQILFPSLAPSATQISEGDAWPKVVEITTENPPKKFMTSLARVLGEGDVGEYFIKIIKDKTEEKEMQESKSEFVDIAAHQLRTPLTSLSWSLESIVKESSGVSESISKTAEEALRVSNRALKIVNDLLEVSKIGGGGESYSMERTALAPFVRQIVGAADSFAKERGISLFFQPIPPEWEGVEAMMDVERLGAALGNLIDNAIKYNTKNGEVSVSFEVFPEKNSAKITVKDTGIGVPEKEVPKIFEKFSRASNASVIDTTGSGLGLYIVRNIVERHGGRVGFESKEGRGSSFWLSIPLAGAAPETV